MNNCMNKKLHISLIFCGLALIFTATSCKSSKSLTKKTLHEFTAMSLINEVENHSFDFDSFQAKMNAKIEVKNKNYTVKGMLRMKKDSIVWMSVSLPMGMEVVRMKITPDSVFILNRNEKTYFCDKISEFSDISPMITSIQFIQSVLVGNDINIRDNDNYTVNVDDNQYNLLISKELKKSIKHSDESWKVMMKDIWIDPELYKITKYYIKEYNDDKRKIELEYSDFEEVNGEFIPKSISVYVKGGASMKARISYSNIVVGEKIDYNFNVPKKYDRIYK